MATAASGPGCFMYFFVVCISVMGYLPFGHHGTDFSRDSKRLAYTYNLKEVRIYDLEKSAAGEPIYTAPDGYVVDTVHWNRGADDIYAVVHNYSRCDENEKTDENGIKTESKIDWQWNVEILRLKPEGGTPASVTKREYYCPDMKGPIPDMNDGQAAAPKKYHAPYQQALEEGAVNFKPTGWADGAIYYVEPEGLTKKPTAVYKMDLSNGKAEKLYEIPEDGSSYMLSPSAKYLVYLSVSGEEKKEKFSVVLRDLKSGAELLRQMVAEPPAEDTSLAKSKDGDADFLMLLGILTGVDGVASFDEAAGKFFYLKMDTNTKKTSLIAFDIATKKEKVLYTAFGLAAPLPIPQKKALLLTSIDADTVSKGGAPMAMPTIDSANGKTVVALISYDGAIIKKYDNIPPILFPLFHMRAPDAALSPDGNKVALTFSSSSQSEDAPKPFGLENAAPAGNPFSGGNSVLPSVIDLEKGTFEILITKPVDYYFAGQGMYEMHDTATARPYLEKFLAAFKPGDPGVKKASFSLYVCYQEAGMKKEQDALHEKIMKTIVNGAESPGLDFTLGYLAAAASVIPDTYNVRQDIKLEDLPNLEALKDEWVDFVAGELKKAETAGSKKASYVLAAVLAKKGKNAEAIKQFEKTYAAFGGTYDDQALNFDFITGQLYSADGNDAKALEHYTKYLGGGGEYDYKMYGRDAHEARAGIYEKLGKWADALADYEFLLDAAKKNYEGAKEANQGVDDTDSYISGLKDEVTKFETKVAEVSGKIKK